MEQQGACGLDFEGGPGNCGAVVPRPEADTEGFMLDRAAPVELDIVKMPAASAGEEAEHDGASGPRASAAARDLQALLAAAPVPRRGAAAAPATSSRAAVAELPRSPAGAALERFLRLVGARPTRSRSPQHYVETFDLHKRSGPLPDLLPDGDKRERGRRCCG